MLRLTQPPLHLGVNFAAFRELRCLLFKSLLNRSFFRYPLLFCIASNVFCYSHGTKVRAAHTAKMGRLGAFGGKRFVVELASGFGIEREIELIFPAKFEPCLGNRIVAVLRAGMAFG